MTNSSPVRGDPEAKVGANSEPQPAPPGVPPEQWFERTEEFDARVGEIRSLYGAATGFLELWVDIVRQRLGVAEASPGSALVALSMHSGIRLLVALLATALFGDWSAVPWGRWATIVLVFGMIEAVWAYMSPPPRRLCAA